MDQALAAQTYAVGRVSFISAKTAARPIVAIAANPELDFGQF
jgi:hypothetical protein